MCTNAKLLVTFAPSANASNERHLGKDSGEELLSPVCSEAILNSISPFRCWYPICWISIRRVLDLHASSLQVPSRQHSWAWRPSASISPSAAAMPCHAMVTWNLWRSEAWPTWRHVFERLRLGDMSHDFVRVGRETQWRSKDTFFLYFCIFL